MTKEEQLSSLIREFFTLLDKVEESDEGRSFHPNRISSCREFDRIKMGKILSDLKELVE